MLQQLSVSDVSAAISVACFAAISLVAQRHFAAKGRAPMGTIAIAAIAVGSVAIFLWCVWTVPRHTLLPIPLYVASLALFLWTVRTTRRRGFLLAFSDFVPTSLTIDGPYRFVRHPFYVSYLLYHLGNAAGTLSWLPWGMLAVLTAVYAVAARNEEEHLIKGDYADAYGAYRRRTGMFFPKIG